MVRLNQVWLHVLSDGLSSCVNEFKVQLFLQLSGAHNDGFSKGFSIIFPKILDAIESITKVIYIYISLSITFLIREF